MPLERGVEVFMTRQRGTRPIQPASSTWGRMRTEFEASLQRTSVRSAWARAASTDPRLQTLAAEPGAVVALLADTSVSLERKDQVLRALVELRSSTRYRDVATTVLWLGLWPGLDAVYRRQLRFNRRSPAELAARLSLAFTNALSAADLRRIRRLAATLLRNAERSLVEEETRLRQLPPVRPAPPPPSRSRPLPLPEDGRAVHSDVRAFFEGHLHQDGALAFAFFVQGVPQKELGRIHGLTHAAVRKRIERAGRVLRDLLDRNSSSHIPPPRPAFTSSRTSRRSR